MRITLFLGALLACLPCAAVLQAQPTIADWERAKAFTLEYLEAMPADQYDFKPTPEIRSFAEQMLHLADANYGLAAAVLGVESPVGRGANEQTDDKSKANVVKLVSASYDFVIEQVGEADASAMDEMVTLFGQFEVSRSVGMDKAFEHQTHHRGQTTLYLRLAGIEPPGEKLF